MEKEPASRRLPRPDLNIKPSTWSAAQTGGLASRVAIVATVAAIFGGISLVFVYPYFNIEQFRKWSMGKSNRTLIRLAISALSLSLIAFHHRKHQFDSRKHPESQPIWYSYRRGSAGG